VAVATTVVVVAAAVASASIGHIYNLTAGAQAGSLTRILPILVFTVPGVLLGEQLGPLVQARLQPRAITIVITLVLLSVGGMMLAL